MASTFSFVFLSVMDHVGFSGGMERNGVKYQK